MDNENTTSAKELRNYNRARVLWQAECRAGERAVPGEIFDASRSGAFFVPDIDLAPPKPSEEFQPGDAVTILYTTHAFGKAVCRRAKIRWVGASSEHGRRGVGLEFC